MPLQTGEGGREEASQWKTKALYRALWEATQQRHMQMCGIFFMCLRRLWTEQLFTFSPHINKPMFHWTSGLAAAQYGMRLDFDVRSEKHILNNILQETQAILPCHGNGNLIWTWRIDSLISIFKKTTSAGPVETIVFDFGFFRNRIWCGPCLFDFHLQNLTAKSKCLLPSFFWSD